jgi:hypothetical protein
MAAAARGVSMSNSLRDCTEAFVAATVASVRQNEKTAEALAEPRPCDTATSATGTAQRRAGETPA